MMFEVGDKIKRLPYYLSKGSWTDGKKIATVEKCDGFIVIIDRKCYQASRFEKVEDNMFTKDMLVPGTHVVELRNGKRAIYIQDGMIDHKGISLMWFGNYEDDLTWFNVEFDVMKVFEIKNQNSSVGLSTLFQSEYRLEPVWTRQEKTQKQIDMEKLGEQIKEMQAQYDKLQED